MISTLYLKRINDDPEAEILFQRLKAEGYKNLSEIVIEKVFRLEGITENHAQQIKSLFYHPETEEVSFQSMLDSRNGHVLEVGYQRAVTDPELPSVIRGAEALGVNDLQWVRISRRYQFKGISGPEADEIVFRYLYNPQVEVIIQPEEKWKTLKPVGETGPVEYIDLKDLTDEELLELSEQRRLFFNLQQMKAVKNIAKELARPLTDGELEMFAQTWSDHCFHTTWKSLGLLKKLTEATRKINHHLVISVFEDNAGAVKFYDGWALTIKGETHNSPSAVSPYGGIMTKHGGVIRDTLGCGQGAWPIGGSTVMGLGSPKMNWTELPEGVLHPRTILTESIKGTADYTNPMGIPMMFPVYRFHPGFTGKCFALGHSIGFIPEARAKKGHPEAGDLVVLIGGRTGRDGLHGATVSSSSMTSKTATVDAAHVQIGHPIEERKFMEAIPVLRDSNCLRAITDLGAAGLSSAAGEMGQDTGVWINLALVPLKTRGMLPWEIWISESQERMLLCVPPDKIEENMQILKDFEVEGAVIGKFTLTRRCQVVYDPSMQKQEDILTSACGLRGGVLIDLDFECLRKGCPLPSFSLKAYKPEFQPLRLPPLNTEKKLTDAVKNVLSHLNVCDHSAAGTQFDSTVQGMTVTGPYGGLNNRMPNDVWISAPVRGKPYGAAASLSFNPFYGDVDAGTAAELMVIESVTKLAAAGVDTNEVVLCDNFYTPRVTSETASILNEMVTRCCDLSVKLKTPFISGKDSSSGTFISPDGKRIDIPPTLAVMALGRLPDVRNVIPKQWQKSGNRLFLAGELSRELGGSVYLDTTGKRGGRLHLPDTDRLKRFFQVLKDLQDKSVIRSSSAVAEGGILKRIFEMALGSGFGCEIDLISLREKIGADRSETGLFTEMTGAVIVEIDEDNADKVKKEFGWLELGRIIEDHQINLNREEGTVELEMNELIKVWERPFREEVV